MACEERQVRRVSTIRVSRKWFARYRSIQTAILDAPIGSVIEIEPGVYKEEVWIDRYVELVGLGEREEVIIEGTEHAALEMGTDYAVVKNLSLKQAKKSQASTVLVNRGSLVIDGCSILSVHGPAISIIGNEAEPVIRRSRLESRKNVAVLNRSQGKVLVEDCHLLSQSDVSVVLIADGNPVFRYCTITGNPGYGIFVEENGKGTFEECNLYGFHHSPAVGINGGNPYFLRCKIHDGEESGIAIHRGKGTFQDCTLFGFGKEFPAVRVTHHSHPRFTHCTIKNCKGGAFVFEEEGSGIVENCDLYGFIDRPAVTIRSEAHPQFLRSRIHDGNREAVVSYDYGKGIMESCELFGFNENVVSIMNSGKLDLLRCKIYSGYRHGVYMAQKAEGIMKDTEIFQFPRAAAVMVTQAADPLFVHCQIHESLQGVKVTENGRGTFEQCSLQNLQEATWEIHESQPIIRHCKEENETKGNITVNHNDAIAFSEPVHRLFSELDGVIGQQQVKERLHEVVIYLDYLQDRKRMGFKTTEKLDFHALFVGPADTGQSQVAKLYAQIIKEMGFLKQGHVVTVELPDLMGEDAPSTEANVKSWLSKANGGVLYISHLPSLTSTRWSLDAMQMLLYLLQQILEKDDPELAIILAGPEHQMKQWLKSHTGLAEQIKNHYVFTDYSPEEMMELFARAACEEDYMIHPSATSALLKEMRLLWNRPDPNSRAARVHDYFQQVKLAHSRRCSRLPKQERTRDVLTTFLSDDLIMKDRADPQPGDRGWLKEIGKY